ncbi:hypothetical protein CBR_g4410 [Chara braunii]|uniref:Uncharacterized protein n=1 Tax=Chara braunii TaxID=69332 RepID=A0A388KHU2_CHABU|nr:hypothetical protein CBR_g4410 [Chara braunii]|eukprot:GBG69577.1 hypothetical protein CBR_g4410 [Chara braunii]
MLQLDIPKPIIIRGLDSHLLISNMLCRSSVFANHDDLCIPVSDAAFLHLASPTSPLPCLCSPPVAHVCLPALYRPFIFSSPFASACPLLFHPNENPFAAGIGRLFHAMGDYIARCNPLLLSSPSPSPDCSLYTTSSRIVELVGHPCQDNSPADARVASAVGAVKTLPKLVGNFEDVCMRVSACPLDGSGVPDILSGKLAVASSADKPQQAAMQGSSCLSSSATSMNFLANASSAGWFVQKNKKRKRLPTGRCLATPVLGDHAAEQAAVVAGQARAADESHRKDDVRVTPDDVTRAVSNAVMQVEEGQDPAGKAVDDKVDRGLQQVLLVGAVANRNVDERHPADDEDIRRQTLKSRRKNGCLWDLQNGKLWTVALGKEVEKTAAPVEEEQAAEMAAVDGRQALVKVEADEAAVIKPVAAATEALAGCGSDVNEDPSSGGTVASVREQLGRVTMKLSELRKALRAVVDLEQVRARMSVHGRRHMNERTQHKRQQCHQGGLFPPKMIVSGLMHVSVVDASSRKRPCSAKGKSKGSKQSPRRGGKTKAGRGQASKVGKGN